MIEKDPSVLDLADFDLESRVDPLFKKTAAAFDEGGVGGLLLNNINVQDDNCSLTLDASQMPVTSDQPCEGTIVHIEEGLFDLTALQSRQICPTFANFKFNSTDTEGLWNFPSLSSGEVGGTGRDGGVDQDSADFTMLDCPPTAPDFGDDGDDDGFGNTPAMDANDDLTAIRGDITALGVCSDNQVAQFVPAAGAESEKTSASVPPGMGDLCLTDLIVPSDYSYFTPAVIASWAGPQHWKLRPRNTTVKKTNETEAKPKKRKGSTSFKVNFTNKPDKSLFAKSKGSTQLSKATLAKLDTSQTTLPRDPHTDVDVLHRLFCRPKWKIRRQKKQAGIVDEGLEGDWYDYSNDNDQLNYCAPANDGDDSDVPLDEPGFSQGFFDQTQPDVPSQPTGTTTDGTELGGDNLVAQPHKVNQVLINYARSAKKVDVKKLKGKMWEVISREPQEEETDSSSDGGGVNFSSMYSKLPSIVSSAMARNISVPICFVCLLHLANEKELVLSSINDLSDFNIAAP